MIPKRYIFFCNGKEFFYLFLCPVIALLEFIFLMEQFFLQFRYSYMLHRIFCNNVHFDRIFKNLVCLDYNIIYRSNRISYFVNNFSLALK